MTKILAAAALLGGLAIASLMGNSDSRVADELRPISPPSPEFRITQRRSSLFVAGHTSSLQHEQALASIVATEFPDLNVTTDYEALGIVPPYWSGLTADILRLLSNTMTADARLHGDTLTINVIIADERTWRDELDALRTTLPEGIIISADSMKIEAEADVAAICQRSFDAFSTGRINFEESNAVLRPSALPRLDRLAALARTCRDSRLRITGHTDGSGSEAWNLRLSLLRAGAVGEYLAAGGVSRKRLEITGVGSAEPVASNETRYGRSLNRRIELLIYAENPLTQAR